VKHDGFRMIVQRDGDRVQLRSVVTGGCKECPVGLA
jgi:hypothetical protein